MENRYLMYQLIKWFDERRGNRWKAWRSRIFFMVLAVIGAMFYDHFIAK